MTSVAVPLAEPAIAGRRHWSLATLLALSDAIAAILLAADLLVICVSVVLRYRFNAPVEWSDDVARGLMVGSSFFGAASALARLENPGVAFVIDRLPAGMGALVDAVGALLVVLIAGHVAFTALTLGALTAARPRAPACRWSSPSIRWASGRCS